MDKIKCPKCEAPRTYQKFVKTSYENFVEMNYQCGAVGKVEPQQSGPDKFKWVKECGFKINNEFY